MMKKLLDNLARVVGSTETQQKRVCRGYRQRIFE